MGYVIVVAVSLLVGAAVYLATLRGEREADASFGFGDEGDHADSAPGPGYTYLRVATTGPSWRDRILGLIALVVLTIIASAALALGIYQLGRLINLTIERFLR